MSLYDVGQPIADEPPPVSLPRFTLKHEQPVQCVRWRPTYKMRRSSNPHNSNKKALANMEDLLVGDEHGNVYYYSVEWPEKWEVERNNWPGQMQLLAVIRVHAQQVCGLSWSPKGDLFATGGNDNNCFLFEASNIENKWHRHVRNSAFTTAVSFGLGAVDANQVARAPHAHLITLTGGVAIGPDDAKQKWEHAAAVKAIAFCPWQDSLVATGGGSNDKCIHFYHTCSGAALATISVSAQVTSLIWSDTRREICATFGYAEPDHPYRIAVFSWPECRQIGAIKWAGGHRALYAIPYPLGPPDYRNPRGKPSTDGSIVVASSDGSVKFHEVWSGEKRFRKSAIGMLAGSDILENIQGIDKEGDVIR